MSAMTMSAALVAGKVSVTSKCVRGTGRVACDAPASIRHPAFFRHRALHRTRCRHPRIGRATPRRARLRPGTDRILSPPLFLNPQVRPQGAVFQVQVRTASSSLVSGERSRSLATAPRRDFGDRWRGGLSGGPRGGHRATRQIRTSTRSQRNGASRDGPHRPRPRRDPRVVPTQPSI